MLNQKGQNTVEYSILIALVIATLVTMQTYVKRGIQGRWKDASDDFVNEVSNLDISSTPATAEKQFEPVELSRQSTQAVLQDDVTYTMEKGGKVTRNITGRTQPAVGDYQQYDAPPP